LYFMTTNTGTDLVIAFSHNLTNPYEINCYSDFIELRNVCKCTAL
jgi:hypothetical protein